MTTHPHRNWRARTRAAASRYAWSAAEGSLPESPAELRIWLENAFRAGAEAEHERSIKDRNGRRTHEAKRQETQRRP